MGRAGGGGEGGYRFCQVATVFERGENKVKRVVHFLNTSITHGKLNSERVDLPSIHDIFELQINHDFLSLRYCPFQFLWWCMHKGVAGGEGVLGKK